MYMCICMYVKADDNFKCPVSCATCLIFATGSLTGLGFANLVYLRSQWVVRTWYWEGWGGNTGPAPQDHTFHCPEGRWPPGCDGGQFTLDNMDLE